MKERPVIKRYYTKDDQRIEDDYKCSANVWSFPDGTDVWIKTPFVRMIQHNLQNTLTRGNHWILVGENDEHVHVVVSENWIRVAHNGCRMFFRTEDARSLSYLRVIGGNVEGI